MEKIRLLLYCTKQPHKLFNTDKGFVLSDFELGDFYKDKTLLNGKIVAECDFSAEKLNFGYYDFLEEDNEGRFYYTKTLNCDEVYKKSCLNIDQLFNYLGEKGGYAIHIKNLNIFDKPRELSELEKTNVKVDFCSEYADDNYFELTRVFKAPQNMMLVRDMQDYQKKILISIRPEWLWNIFSDEQTILVKRKY